MFSLKSTSDTGIKTACNFGNYNSNYNPKRSTMTKNRHTGCPFWSPTSGNCKQSLEGLFIPLDDHIDNLCKSSNYRQCVQHRVDFRTDEVELHHTVSERRQFDRHSGSQEITIIHADEYTDDKTPQLSARVVDFSHGGIRLLAPMQLSRDTTVTCSLDDSFPEHLRSGAAMIRWCRPLLNNNGYQAGLSFRDDRITLALRSNLDHNQV